MLAVQYHNSLLSEKTKHKAKDLADFLLWTDQEKSVEREAERALRELGLAKRTDG